MVDVLETDQRVYTDLVEYAKRTGDSGLAADPRESASRLEVPVYVLDGEAELEGRRDMALEWFEGLQAPSKQLVSYANSAHAVAFEQGDEVQRLLTEVVVPATYAR